jgi:hypothetical protein
MSLRRLTPEPSPALPVDPSTMVICVESFRPALVARVIERGEWRRLDDPIVQAHPERFALPLACLGAAAVPEIERGAT